MKMSTVCKRAMIDGSDRGNTYHQNIAKSRCVELEL